MIIKIREWLVKNMQVMLQSPHQVWKDYSEFLTDINEDLMIEGYKKEQIIQISYTEFILLAKAWINKNIRNRI